MPLGLEKLGYYCYMCMYKKFFAHRPAFLFQSMLFSRALGREARKGPACTHGSSLGPGRGPWRVLWAFRVTKSSK